jgi:heme/copper-type cytochrome/quinol oxidase subunit 2
VIGDSIIIPSGTISLTAVILVNCCLVTVWLLWLGRNPNENKPSALKSAVIAVVSSAIIVVSIPIALISVLSVSQYDFVPLEPLSPDGCLIVAASQDVILGRPTPETTVFFVRGASGIALNRVPMVAFGEAGSESMRLGNWTLVWHLESAVLSIPGETVTITCTG